MSAYDCVIQGFNVALLNLVQLSILMTALYCSAFPWNYFIRYTIFLHAFVQQKVANPDGKGVELFTAKLKSTEHV